MRPLGRANCRRTHARRRGWPVMTRQITTATSSRSRPCPGTVSAGWRTSAARVSGCKAWAWVSRRTNWGTITACGTRIFGMPPSMPAWSGRGRTWSTATFTIRWDLPEPGVTSSTRRTRASWARGTQEYGNIYDTMGLAGAGSYQFNAAHKSKLDWLKADAVQIIASNGVYRIYPFDVPDWTRVDGRSYAAAVPKDFMRYYWLEFRQLFTGNPWLQSGVLLNWSPWPQSNGGTQLIDTTPGSPTFSGDSRDDAALVIGRTFNNNPAGVHITTLARGASGTRSAE